LKKRKFEKWIKCGTAFYLTIIKSYNMNNITQYIKGGGWMIRISDDASINSPVICHFICQVDPMLELTEDARRKSQRLHIIMKEM
jgi:hypothetical protein